MYGYAMGMSFQQLCNSRALRCLRARVDTVTALFAPSFQVATVPLLSHGLGQSQPVPAGLGSDTQT